MTDSRTDERPGYGTGAGALRTAARDIAAQVGLGRVSLRSVAERAGVSHGLVRHHFGSRAGLIDDLIESTVEETMYLGADNPATSLAARLDETEVELGIQYQAMLHLGGESSHRSIAEAYERYEHEASEWLREGGLDPDDRDLVRLVVSALDGLAIGRIALGDRIDANGAMERLIALLGWRKASEPA